MKVKLPRLLDAQMQEKKRLHPSETSITFNLYSPHQATTILRPNESAPRLYEWVKLFTAKGEAGIFRVTGTENDVGAENRLTLHHGLCVLAMDKLKTDEESISGTLSELLSRFWGMEGVNETPKYWRLGSIPNTPVIKYTPVGTDTLLQAVETLMKKTGNCAFSFDQSTFPWVLNVVTLTDIDVCEGRFSRNIEGVNINVDDSDLYTRVYIDGRAGYTDADTIGTWGVSSEILSLGDDATEDSLQAYIIDFLEAHKNPTVTIELSGADLSMITGEPIDSFELGRVCRACLPRYSTTIQEKIVSISYPDVYGNPFHIMVSLVNKAETTPDLLVYNERDLKSYQSNSNRRIGALGSSIEQAYIDIRAQHEQIVDIDGYMTNQFNEVSITLDAINARIDLNATREEINEITSQLNQVSISLDAANAQINLRAKQEAVDALDARVSQAEIDIDGANALIMLKASQTDMNALGQRVSQAEIDIDGANSQIRLKANQTVVDGILSTGLAGVGVLSATSVSGNSGNFDSLSINGNPVVQHSATLLKSVSINAPKTTFTDYYGDQYTVVASVSLSTNTETIVYLST